MNYILVDLEKTWQNFLPLTFTRPISELRIGILTIREKWEKHLKTSCSYKTLDYLSEKFKCAIDEKNILINSSILPDEALCKAIHSLSLNSVLLKDDVFIATCLSNKDVKTFNSTSISALTSISFSGEIFQLSYPWDIFANNGKALAADYTLITAGRKSAPISKTNNLIATENIFLEEGVKMEFCTINATPGPVYLGKNSEVMEGSIIRGGFALCEDSVLKMAAKIYGPTTIGPHCKVGGEINNSIFQSFSNKAHDGFLGNAVIGEWCNLGADTNNSNLKNTYAEVKMWNYIKEGFIPTGLQFCGLVMGDHSKCGINTMFNTGTVVGVSANIFGAGYMRNFIPSFSWGGPQGISEFPLKKAYDVVEKVMERRHLILDETEKKILETIYNKTAVYRRF